MPPGLAGMAGMPGMGNMMGLLAPALLGVQAGSMIGYLAQHALGRYDLPLPTGPAPVGDSPGGDAPSLCFVVPNIDTFEDAWSLPRDDLRFYVALHETVHAATRSVPWVRGRIVRLAVDYVSSYEIDPSAFEAEFGTIDPQDPEAMQRMTESPERVLGAMQSPRQVAPREELQRLTTVVEGYADQVLVRIGRRLIPTFEQIHEAKKRHRVERGEAERFIEGLLGLKLEREHYEQGQAFVDGVIERAGLEGLNRVFDDPAMLPTPERARRTRPLAGPHRPPRRRLSHRRRSSHEGRCSGRGSHGRGDRAGDGDRWVRDGVLRHRCRRARARSRARDHRSLRLRARHRAREAHA